MPSSKIGYTDEANPSRNKQMSDTLKAGVGKAGKKAVNDPKSKNAETKKRSKPKVASIDGSERKPEAVEDVASNHQLEMMQQEQRNEVGGYASQKKNGYRRLPRDENDEEDVDDEEGFSAYRKFCGPFAVLLIGCIIALSQLQLTFETRYDYFYEVKETTKGGDGKTYSYNLWNGVQQLWADGAPLLAMIVFCWSGIFPYFKLVMIALVDYLGRTRKQLSRWWMFLSIFAKWSFLDIWIVVMTVLCVRIDIHIKDQITAVFFITRHMRLDIWTQAVALRGCFLFAIALVCSQFLGHFLLSRALNFKHQKVFAEPENTLYAPLPLKSVMIRSSSQSNRIGTTLISICSLFSFAGLIFAMTAPFFHLEYHFKLHIQEDFIINEKMRADIIETYTVFTAISTVSEPNHIEGENRGLSSMAMAFVVVAPLTRSFCAILLWYTPMRSYRQRTLAAVIDYLSVVAAPEVFGCTAYLMIHQLPGLFENMKEAAEYIELKLTPLMGLYILILFGFMDTFVCAAVLQRYMAALAKESDDAARSSNFAVVDVESPLPVAEAAGTRF